MARKKEYRAYPIMVGTFMRYAPTDPIAHAIIIETYCRVISGQERDSQLSPVAARGTTLRRWHARPYASVSIVLCG